MTAPVNRRQWLISTGLAAGSSALLPSLLPALTLTGARHGSYHDALLDMEHQATARRRAAGPVRLSANENPFGMSPKAKEAISAGWAEHSLYGVPSADALRKAFATHAGVDPSNVLITQGSSETLAVTALAYNLQGGEVVTPWPTFEGLPGYAEKIGATVHKVPLTAGMGHDFEALAARTTNAVSLVFVCNPNNPSSTVEESATIRRFVSATQHRTPVLVDEAYHDFVDDPTHTSLVDLVLKGENVIISRTASKLHGIAGLRIGFAIARPDIVQRLQRFMTGNPNAFGMQAAIASLADTQYQEFVKAKNREGRGLLTTALRSMGRTVAPSHTNFVFFDAGIPVERVQAAMRAKGFLVGRRFPPYDTWCRVSIGTPEEMRNVVTALPETLRA